MISSKKVRPLRALFHINIKNVEIGESNGETSEQSEERRRRWRVRVEARPERQRQLLTDAIKVRI